MSESLNHFLFPFFLVNERILPAQLSYSGDVKVKLIDSQFTAGEVHA